MNKVTTSTTSLSLALAAALVISLGPLADHCLAADINVQNVQAGSAQIEHSGANTIIHAADKTIINYTQFNVGVADTVQFVQPSAAATVLNRVISPDPSYLMGTIQANGCVYFVNNSGIVIGSDAVINAAQFHAAAGNISNADFLGGINQFSTSGGTLSNAGLITAADGVSLIGHSLINTGSVVSDRGLITFCAGESVYISEKGSEIHVTVDNMNALTGQGAAAAGASSADGIVNQGSVAGENVVFSCGDVYSLALINSGTVTAKGGQAVLSSNSQVTNQGTIDVSNTDSGATGGQVKMLGQTVVSEGGTIDASGAAGGGEVLVGGNYQGSGDERTASLTFVDADSSISANATESGDGGSVIVWADGKTGFMGELSVRGGATGGSGGFAEVSGTDVLVFNGTADLSGIAGYGTLLLDPTNIIVATGGAAAYTDVSTFAAGGVTETIAPATLDAVAGNVALQAKNDITISDALTLNTAEATLTMEAGNDININAGVTTSGGALTLSANDADGTETGAGSIAVSGALATTGNSAVGADISLLLNGSSGSVTLSQQIDAGVGTISGTATTVNIDSNNASIADAIDVAATLGTVNITGGITYSEAVSLDKSLTVQVASNTATATSWSSTSGAITTLSGNFATGGGDFDFEGAVTLAGATSLNSAGGNLSFAAFGGGGFDLTIPAGVAAGTTTFAGTVTDLGSGTGAALTIENGVTGLVRFESTVAANNGLLAEAGTNVRFDGNVTISGSETATAFNGDLQLDGLTFSSDGAIALGDATSDQVTISTAAVTISSDETITSTAAVSGNKTISMSAENDIVVQGSVQTTDATANISLTADSEDNGTGGVSITQAGGLNSAGTVSVSGADLSTTGSAVDSIVVAADAANAQIQATGNITLASSTGNNAPTDADVSISGRLVSDTGVVSVSAADQIILDGSNVGGGNLVSSGGGLSLNSPVLLTGDTVLSTVYTGAQSLADGSMLFLDTVDGTFDLTLDAGTGSITLSDSLGDTTALADFTITDTSDFYVPRRALKGNETPGDFGDNYDSTDGTVPVNITAASLTYTSGTGQVFISGGVTTEGQAGQAGGNVQIVTTEVVQIEGVIDASGGAAAGGAGLDGGNVTITSSDAGIRVGGVDVSGSDAAAGAGGDSGDVTLQISTTSSQAGSAPLLLPSWSLVFDGNVTALGGTGVGGANGTGGTVSLNANGRTYVPSVATIRSNHEGLDLTISALNITMGQNEKLSVIGSTEDDFIETFFDGNLTLTGVGGTITVGDLTAENNLTVNAGTTGTIVLLGRSGGNNLLPTLTLASVADSGLDLVAGGALNLTGTLTVGGTNPQVKPTLSAASYTQTITSEKVRVLTRAGTLASLLYGSSTILDGTASGKLRQPSVAGNDAAEVIPSLTASFFSSPITVDTLGAADANSDGMLSRQEIIWYAGGDSAEVDALFASLDTNGDGYISRSELKKK